MKLQKFGLAVLFIWGGSAFAHGDVPGELTIAKATELAVHRIERLVTLKKIDAVFQNQLVGMRAEVSSENGAAFKVYGQVAPGADGKSSQITLWQDAEGKTLAFNVEQGLLSMASAVWSGKDALTLMEDGLHFVLEGWAQYAEVKAYYTGLQTITLVPQKDAQGNIFAQFKITSDDDARTLFLNLNADGTYLSHELK